MILFAGTYVSYYLFTAAGAIPSKTLKYCTYMIYS